MYIILKLAVYLFYSICFKSLNNKNSPGNCVTSNFFQNYLQKCALLTLLSNNRCSMSHKQQRMKMAVVQLQQVPKLLYTVPLAQHAPFARTKQIAMGI